MEYVIVESAEPREVFIDGMKMGLNMQSAGKYNVFTVPPGVHEVKLGGPGVLQSAQTVVIDGTSPINPLRVAFERHA
jgi:hypothetical protein